MPKSTPPPLVSLSRDLGQDFWIKVRDGRHIHVSDSGEGDTICIMLHGFGEGRYVWDQFAPKAAKHMRVITVDFCGHGDSDWSRDGNYTMASLRQDIEEVISQLNPRRVILAGHSMGAHVAVQIALKTKVCVIGVVAIDPAFSASEDSLTALRQEFEFIQRRYQDPGEYAAVLELSRPLMDLDRLAQVAARALKQMADGQYELKRDPNLLRLHEKPATTDDRIDEQGLILRALSCPILLVRGEASAFLTQSDAKTAISNVENGFMETIRLAGHGVMGDNPTAFENVVLPYLRAFAAAAAPSS